jgi:POT family proton-dependent oligopeptide transporter
VCGTGLLKPNISAIVGDLYPEGGARRDAGFSIFYMGINLGAFAGQLITGGLGEKVGWHVGFGAAGVGMFRAALVRSSPRADAGRHRDGAHAAPGPGGAGAAGAHGEAGAGPGLGAVALLFVLAATGVIVPDAQAIGKNMAYVMVGMALRSSPTSSSSAGWTGRRSGAWR